ncbi:VOC family protein [Bacteriovorax sp. DB6_IX]|uniref:VOC family protein n=1 Tax=Bacteriovorax sp. DB6_IX TaxID=1353530 RepID=UPI00038A110C|nr:VOC family protein [Bacteriovorax sp. DB6_IX]EQC52071.1 glyoxalase-like domain protein [Bacteriovorax sp. DB6_IX]
MLDAIGIAARDVDQTLEFYELFNMDFQNYGEGHYEAKTASGMRVMIDSFELLKQINPNWKEPIASGVVLCFLQKTPEEVDLLVSKIKSAGFEVMKEPWDAFWGQRYASVIDPNGNQIDIFATLEK